ncbi:MAG: hypothetical protein GY780_18875 [bacterium]|nr:hypothetical protein [bacterium]
MKKARNTKSFKTLLILFLLVFPILVVGCNGDKHKTDSGPTGGSVEGVSITFKNESSNSANNQVYVFMTNNVTPIDPSVGVSVWCDLSSVGSGMEASFTWSPSFSIQATTGSEQTATLSAISGKSYSVVEGSSGITLTETGVSSLPTSIEISNGTTMSGVSIQLLDEGKVALSSVINASQKTVFIPQAKLFWGLGQNMQEGDLISNEMLSTGIFFEQDLAEVSTAAVTLSGNPNDGFQFNVTN